MEHQVVLETDPETGHVTGTVVGIPDIIVDGVSEEQVFADLGTALRMAREDPVLGSRAPGPVRVVSVDA